VRTVRRATSAALVALIAGGCAGSAGPTPSTGPPAARVTTGSYGPTHTVAGGPTGASWKRAFLRVTPNMPTAQVEALLGKPPFHMRSGSRETCWLYGRSRTDITGGAVCFTAGRVTFVATPELATATFGSTSRRPT
jgi:hypothetical protein